MKSNASRDFLEIEINFDMKSDASKLSVHTDSTSCYTVNDAGQRLIGGRN